MKRTILIMAGVLCAGGVLWAQEADPLKEARTLYRTGGYEKAAETLEALIRKDPDNGQAVALSCELDLELGRYVRAHERCEAFLRKHPRSVPVRMVMVKALYSRGRLQEAYREARRVQVLDPGNLRSQFLQGVILEDRGERIAAKQVYETFIDTWRQTPADKLTAEDATVVGRACARFAMADRNPQMLSTIVNKVYPFALKKDPQHVPALVASGELFLEKHNIPQARKDFDAALRINPNHPEALIGAASCQLRRRKFPEAAELVEKAKAVAPESHSVLLLEAVLDLYEEDYEGAMETAGKVLAVNPARQEALGIKGAALYALDRKDDYAKVEKQALAVNPKCAVFYQSVAAALVQRHRDAEAKLLLEKAVELHPNDSGPAASLGLLLMRLGREEEAKKVLDGAFEMDSFNVLVFNTLNLLDKMKDFAVRKTDHFTIKVHPKTDRILLDYVADYMESIYPEITANYSHDVPHTLVEIFPSHQMFSVRTAGVPNVGTVGACLGPIIVMDSPAAVRPGTFNWAEVLRHEYTHVVTLSATDMRISHWFTEALAVSEQHVPKPWKWYQLVADSVAHGKIMPVTKLNHGFTRARTQRTRQLAYAQSNLIADFVRETWDDGKIAEMLKAYRNGKNTAQMVEAVFDMTAEAFDAKFLEYLKSYVGKHNLVANPDVGKLEEIEKALKEKPDDAALHLQLSRIKLVRRDLTGASVAARKCLEIDPKNAGAHAFLGVVQLRQKNSAAAEKSFKEALKLDGSNRIALRGMTAVLAKRKDDKAALDVMRKIEKLEPLNPGVHLAIARMLIKGKDTDGAIACLRRVAELDSRDYASRRELARLLMEKKDHKVATKVLDELIAIYPYEKQVHQWAAVAWEAVGDKARADRERKLIPLAQGRLRPLNAGERPEKPVEH